MQPFNVISRRFTPEIRKFCKPGGKLDYSRYSQVSLLTLCHHWKTHNKSGDCQRSLCLSAILHILDVLTTLSIITPFRYLQIIACSSHSLLCVPNNLYLILIDLLVNEKMM